VPSTPVFTDRAKSPTFRPFLRSDSILVIRLTTFMVRALECELLRHLASRKTARIFVRAIPNRSGGSFIQAPVELRGSPDRVPQLTDISHIACAMCWDVISCAHTEAG